MGALIGTGEYVELPESGAMLDQAAMLLGEAVPTGAPSDLLRRRPDLLGAEARFREAFAEHQYAIADQYPRFSLSGSAGSEALHGGDLLSSASFAWSFVQQLAVPLFDGGRRKAVRAQRQAQLDAAVAAYRRDVVLALTDVEQSLLSRQATRRALRIQESRLQQAQRQLEVEQARHAAGDSTVGDLLASEQAFEAALQDVLSARGMALGNYVRLHKALGGPA
jgi:multidrug efflux system outer membrane protein